MGNACCSHCKKNSSKRWKAFSSSSAGESNGILDNGKISEEQWFDALEEFHDEEETTFFVSAAELMSVRTSLQLSFPRDCDYMSDDYIISVASKPYSKDMTRRRPLEVSTPD